jgi:hypothetical protein
MDGASIVKLHLRTLRADNALEIAKDSTERGLAQLMKDNFRKAELEFNNSIKLHPCGGAGEGTDRGQERASKELS